MNESNKDDDLYFVWIRSWCGKAPEPQICTETFLPKGDGAIIQKHKLLPPYDGFSLDALVLVFPLFNGQAELLAAATIVVTTENDFKNVTEGFH